MDEILSEASRALGVLIGTGLIVLAYSAAKHLTKDSNKGLFVSILIGMAACVILGLINASNVGSPTCLDSETDNRGTVCNEYDDDGYEPSSEERTSVFTFWFIVTTVPILLGVNSGFRARNETTET